VQPYSGLTARASGIPEADIILAVVVSVTITMGEAAAVSSALICSWSFLRQDTIWGFPFNTMYPGIAHLGIHVLDLDGIL
jgi:hypothetical protein